MTTANQRMSNKHEAEVAHWFGGEVTPMSGAGWVSKNDVRTPIELIECKATRAASYSLKVELLDELEKQGLLAGKRPVLHIKFLRDYTPRRVVVLTEADYLELSRKAGER